MDLIYKCEKCGAKIDKDSKFCMKCGSEFTNENIVENVTLEKINRNLNEDSAIDELENKVTELENLINNIDNNKNEEKKVCSKIIVEDTKDTKAKIVIEKTKNNNEESNNIEDKPINDKVKEDCNNRIEMLKKELEVAKMKNEIGDLKDSINISNTNNTKLASIAYVLLIIQCVFTGWYILPLLWLIPMIKKIKYNVDNGINLSIGFKIFVLLFGNVISGILLLCMHKNENVIPSKKIGFDNEDLYKFLLYTLINFILLSVILSNIYALVNHSTFIGFNLYVFFAEDGIPFTFGIYTIIELIMYFTLFNNKKNN